MVKKGLPTDPTSTILRELEKLKGQLEETPYADTLRASLKISRYLEESEERAPKIIIKNNN